MLKLNLEDSELAVQAETEEPEIHTGKIKSIVFRQEGAKKRPYIILQEETEGIQEIDLRYPYNILVLSAYPDNEIRFIIRDMHAIAITDEGDRVC